MTVRRRNDTADPFADPALKGPGVLRTLQETFGRRRRLFDVVQLEVTSQCVGKCLYCPHTTMADAWKARHITEETFVRLWPLLLETQRVHLQGWGEPFLHPRFLDMVRLCRKADCLVSTTTCGLVMNEGYAESLVDSGLDIIAFSLAGSNANSNNTLREGVDFTRVLNAVRQLQTIRKKKNGVHLEVHFAYLLFAGAVDDVAHLPDLMREYAVHAAVISTLDYLPSPEWKKEAFMPDEHEKIAHARAVLEKTAKRAASMGMDFYYSLPQPAPLSDCLEHPARALYVDAEGAFSPCIYVNLPTRGHDPFRRVFGSCMHDDALRIAANPDFVAFRRALAACAPDAPCLACPKRFAVGNRTAGTASPAFPAQSSPVKRVPYDSS